MTIKKSLISVATAGLLVAGITGCGSSDSDGGTTGTTTQVTAVDGYIYNAALEVTYLDEDNKTQTITYEPAEEDLTYSTIVDGKTVWHEGSSVYKIPTDANDTVKKGILGYKLVNIAENTPKNIPTDAYTPPTYIKSATAHNDYNLSIDVPYGSTTSLQALATSDMVTPLTSLLVNMACDGHFEKLAGLSVGSTDSASVAELNATVIANMEANLTKLKTAFPAIGDVDVSTIDPMQVAQENVSLRVLTAALKGVNVSTVNTAISADTYVPPADFTALTKTLADGLGGAITGNTKIAMQALYDNLSSGMMSEADVASYNLEKSILNGSLVADVDADINNSISINGILVDGTNISDLLASGAKFDSTNGTLELNVSQTKIDTNGTASFKLYIGVKGNKDFVNESDANSSQAMTVVVPFDMNLTTNNNGEGVEGIIVDDAAKLSVALLGTNKQDVYSSSTDINASSDAAKVSDYVTVSSDNLTIKVDIKGLLSRVASLADGNISNDNFDRNALLNGGISNLQVYLEDADSKMISTNDAGTVKLNLATGTFTDYVSAGYGNDKLIKLFVNDKVDARGTDTKANDAVIDTAAISPMTDANTSYTTGTVGNIAIWNLDTANADKYVEFNVSSTDTNERNNTILFTAKADGKAVLTSDFNNTVGMQDNNTTNGMQAVVDTNNSTYLASTTPGAIQTTYYVQLKDEFGKTSTLADNNLTIRLNRAPHITDSNATLLWTATATDNNISMDTLDKNLSFEGNSTGATTDTNLSAIGITLSDYDLDADVNTSTGLTDGNITITALGITSSDFNTTMTTNYNADGNITAYIGNTLVVRCGFDTNATNEMNITFEKSISSTGVVNFIPNYDFNGSMSNDAGDKSPEGYINVQLKSCDKYGACGNEQNISITLGNI